MEGPFLVDTSVWIDFLNGRETSQVVYLTKYLTEEGLVYITPTILQEVLQGIRDDGQYLSVKQTLLNFLILDWPPVEAAIAAANLYRQLRKSGVTIKRANDCLIAAYALHFKVALLCSDADFNLIAMKSALKIL